MAKKQNNKFKNRKNADPKISYKQKFIISTEGTKTEVEYFDILQGYSDHIINTINRDAGKSSPDKVLKDLKAKLTKKNLRKTDEAWIVVDIDNWTEEQIEATLNFSQEKSNYHCAISNPKFEYWLLMHFEEPKGGLTIQKCDAAIKRHIQNYNKGIPPSKITFENVREAIERAKSRHHGTELEYPKGNNNGSTLYLLVEKLLKKE